MPVPLLSTARFHAALLAACIAAGPAAAGAQTGGVTGSVVDAQGLALPGVLIEIRTDDGVRSGSAVTDRAGAFEVADIEPGAYRLTADLSASRRTRRRSTSGRTGPRSRRPSPSASSRRS